MNATKIDLIKWFKDIKYLTGILNTIKDKDIFNNFSNSLLRTAKHVKSCMENYLSKVEQMDVEIMVNKLSTLISNLEISQYLSPKVLGKDTKVFESITFVEIEKWKQCIMYRVGSIISLDKNSKHKKQSLDELKMEIKLLKIYVKGYKSVLTRKLKSSSKKSKSSKKLMSKLKSSSKKSKSRSVSRKTKRYMYKQKLYDLNIIHQQLNNILINLGLAKVSKTPKKSSNPAKIIPIKIKPANKIESSRTISPRVMSQNTLTGKYFTDFYPYKK
jgi:hypothetical protein